MKPLPQTSQMCGFSPVWTLLWIIRFTFLTKPFPHSSQLNGLAISCTLVLCRNKPSLTLNLILHMLQVLVVLGAYVLLYFLSGCSSCCWCCISSIVPPAGHLCFLSWRQLEKNPLPQARHLLGGGALWTFTLWRARELLSCVWKLHCSHWTNFKGTSF